MKYTVYTVITVLFFACNTRENNTTPTVGIKTIGEVVRLNKELDEIISPTASIEIIAEGYDWSEGPLWLPKDKKLIWSDVPANTIYQWSEGQESKIYLKPSGFTSEDKRAGESGSNGLLLNENDELILCQHGDRRIAKMRAPLDDPKPQYETITDRYEGMRYNSPNDAAYGPAGCLYFTDPPYGLPKKDKDPAREIPFHGVYRLCPSGGSQLMTKELSRPNGIAFSPDASRCYVANSDKQRAIWMVYDVDEAFNLVNGRVFLNVTDKVNQLKGLPDGLKVNKKGVLFATGPGGVLIISPEGVHLGTISTGESISNCAFNEDETVLYMTSDMYVVRIKLL